MSIIKFNKKGMALESGLLALMAVSAVTAFFLIVTRLSQDATIRRTEAASQKNIASNAMSVLNLFFKQNSISYYVWVGLRSVNTATAAQCPSPSNLMQIAGDGHKCTSDKFYLFSDSTGFSADPNTDGLRNIYSYATATEEPRGHCVIENSSSNCFPSAGNRLVATVGFNNPEQIPASGHKYKFYFSGFDSKNRKAIFLVEIFSPSGSKITYQASFSEDLKLIYSEGNSALVSDFSETDAQCPTQLFGQLTIYDSTPSVRSCRSLPTIGTLDGLANFKNRIIGFRRNEGLFFDLGAAGSFTPSTSAEIGVIVAIKGSSPVVAAAPIPTIATFGEIEQLTGALKCETPSNPELCSNQPIFMPHKRNVLTTLDEIDALEESDGPGQLYGIRGGGVDSAIYVYDDANPNDEEKLIPICRLGEKGLGLGWDSLAIDPNSDPLVITASKATKGNEDKNYFRLLKAELKSSTGTVYTATIIQFIGEGRLTFANSSDRTVIQCFVVAEQNKSSRVEYSRLFAGAPVATKNREINP